MKTHQTKPQTPDIVYQNLLIFRSFRFKIHVAILQRALFTFRFKIHVVILQRALFT